MPRMPTDQLSHTPKGYRLSCGYYLKDGKKTPKVFWLGHDKEIALARAFKIKWIHNATRRVSGGIWTELLLGAIDVLDLERIVRNQFAAAEKLRRTFTPQLPTPVVVQEAPVTAEPSPQKTAPARSPRLHDAWDAFVKAKEAEDRNDRYQASFVALKHYQADCDLNQIDFAWLQQFTQILKSRPLSRKKSSLTGKHEPIRPATVLRLLKHSRQAFVWIHRQRDGERFGHWTAPSEWKELFTLNRKQIMTKSERDQAADGPQQLTIDEIVRLYHAALASRPDVHPILVLMGLFTGQGQTELSVTRRDEFDLAAGLFTHRRNKTGQLGRYWLPPELVQQLKAYFKKYKATANNLAFLTRKGQPLVSKGSDAVRQAFEDWRKAAKIDRIGAGFYALRRFFGDYATRHGGETLGQVALAHVSNTMLGKHYSGHRDFDKLAEVSRKLHAELVAAGMFRSPTDAADEVVAA